VAQIAAEAAAAAGASPHFGAANAWSELPCVFWPAGPQITPHAIGARGTPRLLVIAGREDPATPYQWGTSLSRELSNAELLTSDAPGHGAFLSGLNCVDGAVADYLVSLKLPADGTSCSR
jgi:pimeloyl-ACP methyl ester carboxylesterase